MNSKLTVGSLSSQYRNVLPLLEKAMHPQDSKMVKVLMVVYLLPRSKLTPGKGVEARLLLVGFQCHIAGLYSSDGTPLI